MVHGDLRLAVGGVREHELAVAVAHSVHALDVRAQVLVSQDLAALGGNAQLLFQIQPLDVGAAAGGQEHAVARDGV